MAKKRPRPDEPADAPQTNGAPQPKDHLAHLRRRVTLSEKTLDAAKKAHAKARKDHDLAVAEFFAEYDRLQGAGEMPLFTPPPEAWRTVPLAEVLRGLPEKKLEILAEAELRTLGELEDFRAAKGAFDWGLKGIGAENRSKIEELVLDYWQRHPQPAAAEPKANGEAIEPGEVKLAVIFEGAGLSESLTAKFKAVGIETYG